MLTRKTLFIIAGIGIGIVLFGLIGWFVFLDSRTGAIRDLFEGRGLGTEPPSFELPIGSTYSNLTGEELRTDAFIPEEIPRLWRLSTLPSAGIVVRDDSPFVIAQYTDRQTGHIFETNLFTGTTTRISNTVIPEVYESIWVATSTVIMRQLNEARIPTTFLGTVTATSSNPDGSGSLTGTYLEQNISEVTPHPEGNPEVLYLVKNSNGVSGMRINTITDTRQEVWSSALRGWNMSWINDSQVVLSQYASGEATGSAYLLSLSDQSVTPLVRQQTGLAITVHPNGQRYAYSTIVEGKPRLFIGRVGGGEIQTTAVTFADKCVWNPNDDAVLYCAIPSNIPDGTMPDAWYRGEVHFSDMIANVNSNDGSVVGMVDPEKEYGISIDVSRLSINESGSHLGLIDATNQTPWVFGIQE